MTSWKLGETKKKGCSIVSARIKGGTKMETVLEQILDRNNMNIAYIHVLRNKGSHGVDLMTINELSPYLKENGKELIKDILDNKYKPNPVRRVEIPKEKGGVRKLGIPTVVDRVIQQAINQVLTPYFETIFSDNSYGFRPKRSCHDALKKAVRYMNEGKTWVVDIDLEKFFDKVNHDKLMYKVALIIKDKRVLKLIRAYLNSGILINGIITTTEEGTPQGGPLSPLLANIMLHDVDMELERRGLSFVRYADDIQIYVKSPRAGERVMASITDYIEGKLKLKVNQNKSNVGQVF